MAPPRPHSPSTWLPEITPNIEAYAENINFDTAADVGLTSNYSLLHQPRACHQVIQGIGDTRVVYTHEGLVIIQPKRHGPAIAIRTLFKPGPPLTLIPGHLLGQDGWSFEGVNQTLHLKHQGEVQGDFPRATVSGAGALLHNQYPLPDRVIQWPASEPVLFPGAKQEPPRPVHLNHREADLMSCALHHAQVEWCQILCPPPWDITPECLPATPEHGAGYEGAQSMTWEETVGLIPRLGGKTCPVAMQSHTPRALSVWSARHAPNSTSPKVDDQRQDLATPITITAHTVVPSHPMLADMNQAEENRPGHPVEQVQEQPPEAPLAPASSDSEGHHSEKLMHYAREMINAHSVSHQCALQYEALQQAPFYIEAKGTPNSFNSFGRDTHFIVIAHDEHGQPKSDEKGEPLVGILVTSWNACLDEIVGLCPRGKGACDRYHVGIDGLGEVMSQLPLVQQDYSSLGVCKESIRILTRFEKGKMFSYSAKQMEAAAQKVAQSRERRQQASEQQEMLERLRAQTTQPPGGQLMLTEAPAQAPIEAQAPAEPRSNPKAAARAKVARKRRKKIPKKAAAAPRQEEKQLMHGKKKMKPTSRQHQRAQLQAALDALDNEEQGSQYGHYQGRQPYRGGGPDPDYEGFGPAPGERGYPNYGPWSGEHQAPRRREHQASNRYPQYGGMDPYRQPRPMYDPYGHAQMDDRPRLQIRKRPAQSQDWGDMSDKEPVDGDDNYEGDDDDGEDSNSQD